jgi:3D (Asp-Asp-Asp) domain-containing protein
VVRGLILAAVLFVSVPAEGGERSRAKRMQATAYCQSGTTASGTMTRPGIVAADPRVLPQGSLIRITAPVRGYSRTYRVEDTGGAVKGRIVDIYVHSCAVAKHFGRRIVDVHVLRLGPRLQLAEK